MKPGEPDLTYPLSRLRERVGMRADAKDKARDLRSQMTDAETLLWQHLRARRFQGFKFRRQRPLGPFILDFVCLEVGLVIELDGGQHAETQTYDVRRTVFIEQQGLRVIRFWNHDVLNQAPAVLEQIWQALKTLTPTLSRKREREQTAASREDSADLTPTLFRKRERGQDIQEAP
jgi:very-short-patch-repair endonuclease